MYHVTHTNHCCTTIIALRTTKWEEKQTTIELFEDEFSKAQTFNVLTNVTRIRVQKKRMNTYLNHSFS